MELKITIEGLQPVAEAIRSLAGAIHLNNSLTKIDLEPKKLEEVAEKVRASIDDPAPLPPPSPTPPPITSVPGSAPQPTPTPPPITVVPTTPRSYTLDELGVAGARLMQTLGMPALTRLIQSFGVISLQDLPKERYNEFAAKLREMGAPL